ncbi:MAG: tRNA (N6-threonylcarbamoyladenosine(37)-N6)-methyltransferase TrmO [Pseudomonadales bacterium]|jgi:tRNA-Thr(GGU) m(6)t(6)A37 methyltransferase TsaA|nr:tRNA (N6-threonylcarbamoyladenosine(37)-N6)-methyltransferase TrmO [Pseudomonadales bacterium]
MQLTSIPLTPIAYAKSPYKQKFAIPRQSNLVQAEGELVFEPAYADPNALRGLEGFSHLWLIFVFHATADAPWSATVTPPRLGGTTRVGVFATRSPYRPNPLGLSVVEFIGSEQRGKQLCLKVRGLDLLDGTPILDIKPYVPYADAIPGARATYAPTAPGGGLVHFSEAAREQLEHLRGEHPQLETLIRGVLAQDPRPAQHARDGSARDYGMYLDRFNIRWRMQEGASVVLSIAPRLDTPHQAT